MKKKDEIGNFEFYIICSAFIICLILITYNINNQDMSNYKLPNYKNQISQTYNTIELYDAKLNNITSICFSYLNGTLNENTCRILR